MVPGAARHASSLPCTRFAATAALKERPGIDCPAVDPWERPGRAICLAATATAMQAQIFALARLCMSRTSVPLGAPHLTCSFKQT